MTSGLVVKRKEAAPGTGIHLYKLLTLKSTNHNGFVDMSCLDEFWSAEQIDEKYLTKSGDIIMRLSAPFTTIAISEEQSNILVPSLFVILRTNRSTILPEYVSIYLNSDIMKKQYLKDASGSAIQMIKASSIKDYTIEVIDKEKQYKVVEINRLILHEINLLEELLENKKLYNKLILDNLMNGGYKNGN